MKKTFIITFIILFIGSCSIIGICTFAQNTNSFANTPVTVSTDYFYQDEDSLDYDNYINDPSQEIYNSTQNQYIYDNYGSSASMEYLNRGDAANYNGGGDFDRNY